MTSLEPIGGSFQQLWCLLVHGCTAGSGAIASTASTHFFGSRAEAEVVGKVCSEPGYEVGVAIISGAEVEGVNVQIFSGSASLC